MQMSPLGVSVLYICLLYTVVYHIEFESDTISLRIQKAQNSTREIQYERPPVEYYRNMNHKKKKKKKP